MKNMSIYFTNNTSEDLIISGPPTESISEGTFYPNKLCWTMGNYVIPRSTNGNGGEVTTYSVICTSSNGIGNITLSSSSTLITITFQGSNSSIQYGGQDSTLARVSYDKTNNAYYITIV